ncbi:MBL fold metallo-hydrolase [Mycolicibacterium sp.]|uniref:MBL fold metallo-hydrolase n=1 Tax=Mycolicibacterium sp. TaxID=2320850 RepID=UPI003D0F3DFA
MLELKVFTSPVHQINGGAGGTFSPTTATLVFGATEALLVDTLYMPEDIDALGDMIDGVGRRLTTIAITHGHADHYFGIDRLTGRFPDARVVATPAVAADIGRNHDDQVATFSAWFPDIALPGSAPQPAPERAVTVDGHAVRLVDVDQADIAPSSVVHIPVLDAIIAGDLAYNGIHQMLALIGPQEWARWAASVDAVAELAPRIVIAGHKDPQAADDGPRILRSTRAYLDDFAELAKTATSARDLVGAMQQRYPDHGNLTTLIASAQAAMRAHR